MTKKEFKMMAEILRDTKPKQLDNKTGDIFYHYAKIRLHNDIISRFNVAFIIGNPKIQQSEFIGMMR